MKPSHLWINRDELRASLAALTAETPSPSQAKGAAPTLAELGSPPSAQTEPRPPEPVKPPDAPAPHLSTPTEGAKAPIPELELPVGPASTRLEAFVRWAQDAIGSARAVLLGKDGLVLAPTDIEPGLRETTSELVALWQGAVRALGYDGGGTCRIEVTGGPFLVLLAERASWGMCGFAAILDRALGHEELMYLRTNLQSLIRSLDD